MANGHMALHDIMRVHQPQRIADTPDRHQLHQTGPEEAGSSNGGQGGGEMECRVSKRYMPHRHKLHQTGPEESGG